MQPSLLYFPGGHVVVVHACGSLDALMRCLPLAHVFSVHAELSVTVEYLPEGQGAHDTSADAVPATDPSPAEQDGVENG